MGINLPILDHESTGEIFCHTFPGTVDKNLASRMETLPQEREPKPIPKAQHQENRVLPTSSPSEGTELKVKFILSLNCAEVHWWTKVECKSHNDATEHVQQYGAQDGCRMGKPGLGDKWPSHWKVWSWEVTGSGMPPEILSLVTLWRLLMEW